MQFFAYIVQDFSLYVCNLLSLAVANALGSSIRTLITAVLQGYSLARLLGYKEAVRRTISIEVGMQNSALGVMLAQVHFSYPLTVRSCLLEI